MKRLHTLPTDNVILEYLANDTLDRNADVVRFCSVLDTLHECTSISIDGPWGSGKTFFVKLAMFLLEGCCPGATLEPRLKEEFEIIRAAEGSPFKGIEFVQNHSTVYYDAWINDNDIDPILSIISAIVVSGQVAFKINKDRDAINTLSSLAECLTGRSFIALSEAIRGQDLMEQINKSYEINKLMEKFLTKALGKENDRLIVFIDELDRCKPSFAVSLLERIKHFFTDERITFVFSLNQNQLQHTVKSYYGYGLDASKYLEKMFDISIPLPAANTDKFMSHLGFQNKRYAHDRVCNSVIRYFNMGLREISKFKQYLEATISGFARDRRKLDTIVSDETQSYCLLYIAPILIGLRIHNITKFSSFIDGNYPTPFVDILTMPDFKRLQKKYLLVTHEVPDGKYDINRDITAKGPIHVDLNIRLLDFYNAIFKDLYYEYSEKTIGRLTVNKYTKDLLIKYINPLSEYAQMNP